MYSAWNILFLSAEVAPFAKTGGLGDVGGALPKALRAIGHDVRVVLPAYRAIEEAARAGRWGLKALPFILKVPVRGEIVPAGVFQAAIPGSDVPAYFIAENNLFNRENLYGYPDDPYRFAFYSRAALELARTLNWQPDVVHAHDWHAAPALMWLATAGQGDDFFKRAATLFTIHNLAHQGRAPWDITQYLGVWTHRLAEEGPGEINFMARGIYHTTLLNTVSPTYAREIMTREGGASLDGLLRFRHYDLHGILNGIDTAVWNPQDDPNIPVHFTADYPENRLANKRALQARLGLPQRDDVPMVAMVTRLDQQKGLDIVGHPLHLLLNGHAGEAQMVVLGTGTNHYEAMLAHLASYHRDKMRAVLEYAGDLAPLIYAGSDLFLMPSLFEPCGLGQLIAMRYGSVPLVRMTGGLSDTVQDGMTGFTFYNFSGDDLWYALRRALFLYRNDVEAWRRLQTNGMRADYSWKRAALGYHQLYEWGVARRRAEG